MSSTVIRVLVGFGLFTLGFQLGRIVGHMDPVAEELSKMRRRQGIVIDGELAEDESVQKAD
jgi:hypothetical protein